VGTLWRRMALMDPRTQVWETYNIPMDWGCLRVRRAASVNGESGLPPGRREPACAGELKGVIAGNLIRLKTPRAACRTTGSMGWPEGKDGVPLVRNRRGSRASRMAPGRTGTMPWASCRLRDRQGRHSVQSDPSKVSQHHAKQKEEIGLPERRRRYNPNYIVSLGWTATHRVGGYVGRRP